MNNVEQKTTDIQERIRKLARDRIHFYQEKILQEYGLHMRCGTELEFYALDHDGNPTKTDIASINAKFKNSPVVESVTIEDGAPDRVYHEVRIGKGMGNKKALEEAPHRYSPAVTAHSTEVLRSMIQNELPRNDQNIGKVLFEAMPFDQPDRSALGLHFNVSLFDGDGNNVFANWRGKPNALARHAADEINRIQKDSVILYAPNNSSYSRIAYDTATPISFFKVIWGSEDLNKRVQEYASVRSRDGAPNSIGVNHNKIIDQNKPAPSVSLRYGSFLDWLLNAGMAADESHAEVRIEDRLAGADANTYLVALADTAAMYNTLQKWTEKQPTDTDKTTSEAIHTAAGTLHVKKRKKEHSEIGPITRTVEQSLDRFRQSDLTTEILGPELKSLILESYKDRQNGPVVKPANPNPVRGR
jgi:glutamine synthetase